MCKISHERMAGGHNGSLWLMQDVVYYLYFDTLPFVSILGFDANIHDTPHDRSPIAVPV